MKKIVILLLIMICVIFTKQEVYAFSGEFEINPVELEREYAVTSLVDDWGYILQMDVPESGRIRIWIKDYTYDFCDEYLYISDVGNASFEELEGFEARYWKKGKESMHSGWITVNDGEYISKLYVSGRVNDEAVLYVEYEKQSEYYGESESNDSFDEATMLEFGRKYEGNYSKEDDKDYYKFVLKSSALIKLTAMSDDGYNGFKWCDLYSEDSNGNVKVIFENNEFWEDRDWESDNLRLPAGTYYVEIDNHWNDADYNIQVDYQAENGKKYEVESNNISKNANKRELKQKITGNLNNDDDQDYFKFRVPVDSYVSLESWIPRGLETEIWKVSILDSELNLLQSVTSTSNPYMKIEDILVKKGYFYVLVEGDEEFYNIYDYSIRADAVCAKHKNEIDVIKQATTKKNGKIRYTCQRCGFVREEKISRIKSVKLSAEEYTYDKKVKKPSVTVYGADGKKIKSNNYSVTYAKGCKNIGTYKVTVKFKGNYSGTITKSFKINPKKTSISSLLVGKKEISVKWKNLTSKMGTDRITGYQIQYSSSNKFTNSKTINVKGYKSTSYRIRGLSSGKTYYIKVRTYIKVGDKTYYSGWSTVKKAKTK